MCKNCSRYTMSYGTLQERFDRLEVILLGMQSVIRQHGEALQEVTGILTDMHKEEEW